MCRDQKGFRRELPGLRRSQSVAANATRRAHHSPLHGCAIDEENGSARGDSWQAGADHVSDKATPCPLDHVNRQFRAPRPNVLWVSDFTYVATWTGFVYVAFVIDAYARRIVGWCVSRSARAGFVFDALEQAIHDRKPVSGGSLVHHSDAMSDDVDANRAAVRATLALDIRWKQVLDLQFPSPKLDCSPQYLIRRFLRSVVQNEKELEHFGCKYE